MSGTILRRRDRTARPPRVPPAAGLPSWHPPQAWPSAGNAALNVSTSPELAASTRLADASTKAVAAASNSARSVQISGLARVPGTSPFAVPAGNSDGILSMLSLIVCAAAAAAARSVLSPLRIATSGPNELPLDCIRPWRSITMAAGSDYALRPSVTTSARPPARAKKTAVRIIATSSLNGVTHNHASAKRS